MRELAIALTLAPVSARVELARPGLTGFGLRERNVHSADHALITSAVLAMVTAGGTVAEVSMSISNCATTSGR